MYHSPFLSIENSHILVTSLIDASTYDGANRLIGRYQQDPGLTWYLYQDGSGNITRTSSKSVALAGTPLTAAVLTSYAADNSRITTSNTPGTITTPANDGSIRGLVEIYQYDNASDLISTQQYDGTQSNPDTRTTTFRYDAMGRPTRIITPDPGPSAATVAGEMRNTDPAAGEVDGYIATVLYDNVGNTYRTTDVLGNTVDMRYDLLHRPISVTVDDPAGGAPLETTLGYTSTPIGWQVEATDAAGRQTLVEQDFLGRTFRTQLPPATSGAARATYVTGWDTDGAVSGSFDPDRNANTLDYDARGRVTSSKAPYDGSTRPVISYSYLIDGLLASVTDPLGRTTSFAYDAGGRVQQQTAPDPDGTGPQSAATLSYARDALGNVLQTTDGLGHGSSVTLDARFRTTASTDAAGNQTQFDYDALDQLLSVTDARSNVTGFDYDRWGRNYRETQGTDARTSLIDAAGNTRQYTDRDGRVTTFEYDDLYRPTREVWKNSSDQEIREFVYDYDAVGNLLSVADNTIDPSSGARTPASDSIQLVYDDLDQVQLERTVNPLVGTSTILDHDYNLGGRPTQTAVNLGGTIQGSSISGGISDLVNQYAWDGLGRMTSVVQTSQSGGNAVADKLATLQYDTASELTDLRRYSATSANSNNLEVHSRWTYDQAGRLQSITHAKSEIAGTEHWDGTSTLPTSLQGGALLAGYYLQYDQANRLTGWSSYYDAFKTTYSYDVRDELTGATHAAIAGLTPPAALPAAESYAFDTTGNRLLAGGTSSSASGTYNEVQNDGTYTYDYDAEGNHIRRTHGGTGAVTEYEYDYRNRLVKVTERASVGGAATQIIQYQYDALDRRTGKELDSDADGVVDRREAWAWDADQVLLQLVDADGDGGSTWKLADRYLYGAVLDMVLADEQLPNGGIALNSVSSTAGTVLWPLGDHLGSERDLVDSNGVIREHMVYDSFGQQLSETDFDSAGTPIASSSPLAVDTLFGFTGREWDADTELQYNRARWYDPAHGRWLGQDRTRSALVRGM